MEKYTKWADKAKGINPFVPSKPRLPRALSSKVGFTVLFAPIILPRLLLFSTCVTAAVLGRVLITPIGVVVLAAPTKDATVIGASVVLGTLMYLLPIINQKLVRIMDWSFLAIAFGVLGVSMRDEPVSLRRLGFSRPGESSVGQLVYKKAVAGDLICCNFTNLLEVLYLARRCSPAYALPTAEGRVVIVSLPRMLQACIWSPQMVIHGRKAYSLPEALKIAKTKGKALALFAEGVRSNGDGILYFPPCFSSILGKGIDNIGYDAHLIAFQYPNPTEFSAAHPVGSALWRLYWMASHVRVYIEVMQAACMFTTAPPDSTIRRSKDVGENFRDFLATMIRKHKLNLGIDDFLSFTEYYSLLSKGEQDKAARIASMRSK